MVRALRTVAPRPQPDDVVLTEKDFHGLFLTVSQLRQLQLPGEQWHVEKLLAPGAKMLVAGRPKLGKSLLVTQLLLAAGSGEPFLDFAIPEPLWAVYIQYEVTVRKMQERIIKQSVRYPNLKLEPIIMTRPPRGRPIIDMVDGAARAYKRDPDLVIVDPLVNTHDLDENNAQQMKAHLDTFDDIIDRYGCSIVLVHHARKESQFQGAARVGLEAARGSIHITAWPNSIITLSQKGKDVEMRFDLRDAEPQDPLVGTIDRDTLTFSVSDKVDITYELVQQVLEENPRIKDRKELALALTAKTGWSRATVYRRLAVLGLDPFELVPDDEG